MKKSILLIVISAIIYSSCDIIETPYISPNGDVEVDVEFPELNRDSVIRKVLMEEFTGHRCLNCPEGHERLAQLLTTYGDSLVAVCIHAGALANTNIDFPYDFRTEAGTQLYNDFGLDPVPIAIINRKQYNIQWGVELNSWQNAIEAVDRSEIYAGIQLINVFKSNENRLYAYSKTTMLKEYANPVQLSLFLIEDGIVSPQKDGVLVDTFYVHNHILRLGINGTYGSKFTVSGIVEKDSSYTLGYPVDFTGKDWDISKCTIVAILHDPSTREVLQVEARKAIE